MTRSELDLIRRALQLLHKIVPDEEIREVHPVHRQCPVISFARRYLARQPGADITSAELWQFYAEVAAAGELEPLTRQEFLRALPGAMAAAFGVNKCHGIQRDGRTVRGFKNVGVREQSLAPSMFEIAPE